MSMILLWSAADRYHIKARTPITEWDTTLVVAQCVCGFKSKPFPLSDNCPEGWHETADDHEFFVCHNCYKAQVAKEVRKHM